MNYRAEHRRRTRRSQARKRRRAERIAAMRRAAAFVTLLAAVSEGRRSIGVEASAEYAGLASMLGGAP